MPDRFPSTEEVARSTGMTGPRIGAVLIATWGIGGVLLLLCRALVRLTPFALEPLRDGSLTWWQTLLYAAWVGLNAWAEGYRAFQGRFSPRVVARALHLGRNPRPWLVVLAPAYCMSLLDARRRDLIASWLVVAGIAVLVVAIRHVPQPWRGMIDGGVVVGLAWGVVATAALFVRALGKPPTGETPDSR
jgi:hypothetical protein